MKQKKSNSNQILMSIVALVLVVIVGTCVTYSWIEEGKTYSVHSNKAIEVKTDDKTDTLSYAGVITLDPDSENSTLSLLDYDETSNLYQSLVFSPVYSADGKGFSFPVTDSEGRISSRRASTTNDIGTKFIKFDFDVKAAKQCIVSFKEKPTITATKAGVGSVDTSAFRILVSFAGYMNHIFSTADTKQTTTVYNIWGGTSTLEAKPFDAYVYDQTTNSKLFEFYPGNNVNVIVSVWLDAGASPEQLAALEGCDIKFNMDLTIENV